MKRILQNVGLALTAITVVLLPACETDSMPGASTVKKWENIPLKAIYEVPAPSGRTEDGTATLELLSDNSLKYTFQVNNLTAGDALTLSHIHSGDAGTAGPVLINLNPSFSGNGATGVVTGLRQGQIDTLRYMPVYINVHSSQVPAGLVRGQLDKQIDFAIDVALSGANEAPNPVTTTATGLAILRLTKDKILYSKVTVSNLESNDTLTASHVHRGAVGVNGPVRITLAGSEADFGMLKISQPLPDSLVSMLKNDPVYVNAHSKRHTPGLIRGQIR